MYNNLLDSLSDYPFQRLNGLLSGVTRKNASAPTIMLSIGEPQHKTPDLLHVALAKHANGWNKYPPTNGTAEFRGAVADWLTRRYCLEPSFIDPDQHILPVAGTREGLFMAAQLTVPRTKNGRRPVVLIPNPFYQVYFGAAIMAGAEPVFVPAIRENGYQPNWKDMRADCLGRAALAYICTPSNPQGTAASLDLLIDAISLARANDFVLVSDECYSEIYYDKPPPSAIEACASLGGSLKNVLVFNSLSKRSNSPGLRSGFVSGDPDLVTKLALLRAHGGPAQPLPVLAAASVLWKDEGHVKENQALYREKFDDAATIFGDRFEFYKPDGGFFLWLRVDDGIEATQTLWREAGIRVLPGAFLAKADQNGINPGAPYIRLALVHGRAETAAALNRINDLL